MDKTTPCTNSLFPGACADHGGMGEFSSSRGALSIFLAAAPKIEIAERRLNHPVKVSQILSQPGASPARQSWHQAPPSVSDSRDTS